MATFNSFELVSKFFTDFHSSLYSNCTLLCSQTISYYNILDIELSEVLTIPVYQGIVNHGKVTTRLCQIIEFKLWDKVSLVSVSGIPVYRLYLV